MDTKSFEKELTYLIEEIATAHRKKLLLFGRKIVPTLTSEDLLQPNDYDELENNPLFRYEEGVLAGIQTAQTAIKAFVRNLELEDLSGG